MRLVIDLQGAQSDSRSRGIGRYSRSLALAMAADPGAHEVVIALNGGFVDAAVDLRDAFAPMLPAASIQLWQGPGGQTAGTEDDAGRRRAAERIRAAFIETLRPDLLLVTSLFEGFADDAVATYPPDVNAPPTVGICYDLVPRLNPDMHVTAPAMHRFYDRALLQLRHSAGLLAISGSGMAETVAGLDMAPDRVANIMAGVGRHFRPAADDDEPQAAVLARYGLQSGYILCVGAVEPRKNLGGLIRAYGLLPPDLRRTHPLVVTGWSDPQQIAPLRRAVTEAGLAEHEVRLLTTFVPDSDLPALYRGSAVAVSPSFREVFGTSVAEAMACGTPAICSNVGSLPEVIGRPDAMFDPSRPESIAERLRVVLEQPHTRDELRRHALARAGLFTWPQTARRTWEALERFLPAPPPRTPRNKRSLAVVTTLADDQPNLLPALTRLAARYAVSVVSDDANPANRMLASAFPVQTPAWLDTAPPDRLLFVPGDDPHHTALTMQLSYAFAGIVLAGPRPITTVLSEAVGTAGADLLHECLLESYGWQAAVAAREGAPGLVDRYRLEPMLRARSVALLDIDLDALTAETIEACYAANPRDAVDACTAAIAGGGTAGPEIARALAITFAEPRPPTLFLDVTTLAVFDAGTGIQRVVREITRQLGRAHEIPARVEPVRSTNGTVTLARAYGRRLFGLPDVPADILPAMFRPGDVYVCLDLSIHDLPGLTRTINTVRAGGGRAVVVIYDLLPVLQAAYFPQPVQQAFPLWLHTISSLCDGLLTISRTVADELIAWLKRYPPHRTRPLGIGWFHLGSDFNAATTHISPPGRPELLMVGTVEPRKGHREALDAMEQLWKIGADAGLVIVGRGGWDTDLLQARLHGHAEAGNRLRWIERADDEQVAALYRRSAALLMASEGEGFGLPIVEAAHAGLPVIARDIPVFREICGDSAVYFEPGKLAPALHHWLDLHAAGRVPDPAGILAISWAQASRRMAEIVLEGDWYAVM